MINQSGSDLGRSHFFFWSDAAFYCPLLVTVKRNFSPSCVKVGIKPLAFSSWATLLKESESPSTMVAVSPFSRLLSTWVAFILDKGQTKPDKSNVFAILYSLPGYSDFFGFQIQDFLIKTGIFKGVIRRDDHRQTLILPGKLQGNREDGSRGRPHHDTVFPGQVNGSL